MTKRVVYQKVSIAQAVRDTLIASMNKGQFPLAVVALIVIAVLYKMPSEDVSKLVFQVADGFLSGRLVGWALGGVTSVGWLIHSRWQRRMIHKEMENLSFERSELQRRLLNGNIASSE
jgi:hypothetical protein